MIESPNVLGIIDDHWFKYVGDLGNAGPDQGKGGKFLLLPPGYSGEVPSGYHVFGTPTYGNLYFWRGFVENGSTQTAVDNDFHFYEEVDHIVKEEPSESLNSETLGLLAAIGIKDKPFAPDERMKKILTDAAAIANATAR